MTQRNNVAGGSMLDLILAMAHDAANADKEAQHQIERGSIPHMVQPDNVLPEGKDFDAKGFEDFMTYIGTDYYDGSDQAGYQPDFVLVDDEDDGYDVFDAIDSDMSDEQVTVSIYVENINISIGR